MTDTTTSAPPDDDLAEAVRELWRQDGEEIWGEDDIELPLDAPLLDLVLKQIETDPTTWEQGTWRCGSAMCFAGHAVDLAGWQWLTDGTGGPYQAPLARRVPGAQIMHARRAAKMVLGLTEMQAMFLFSGGNTLPEVCALVAAIKDGVSNEADLMEIRRAAGDRSW